MAMANVTVHTQFPNKSKLFFLTNYRIIVKKHSPPRPQNHSTTVLRVCVGEIKKIPLVARVKANFSWHPSTHRKHQNNKTGVK